jgi:cell division septation protein DedD
MAKEKQNSVRILQATSKKKNSKDSSLKVLFATIGGIIVVGVGIFTYILTSQNTTNDHQTQLTVESKEIPELNDIKQNDAIAPANVNISEEDLLVTNTGDKELKDFLKNTQAKDNQVEESNNSSPFAGFFGIDSKKETAKAKAPTKPAVKSQTATKTPVLKAEAKPSSTSKDSDNSKAITPVKENEAPKATTSAKATPKPKNTVEEEFTPQATVQTTISTSKKVN